MIRKTDFYIDGKWVAPAAPHDLPVINPADEQPFAVISLGGKADVDRAVAAARAAFEPWAATPLAERITLVERLLAIYNRRAPEMAKAISLEMGAPIDFALSEQAGAGTWHIEGFLEALKAFDFEHETATEGERVLREPIGVCGLITPWNWPMNQVTLKVVPAVAVGCTVILKPSEIAPISSMLFAEMMDEAGFPKGVFNLVNGDGAGVGEAMSGHPDIDMISFTGSTRAGRAITRNAAETIKRVTLELGGKSPNLIFADADLPKAVRRSVVHCMENTGQSCNAPTRMLVERKVYDQVVTLAAEAAKSVAVGDPAQGGEHIGPLVSELQFNKVRDLIEAGIREGARLVAGGPGRPAGFNRGYFAQPTVFADVNNEMRIAREEIFGPVLAIIPFDSEDDGVKIANDTPYGLAAYLSTGDDEKASRVARRLRAGMIHVNGKSLGRGSPFGGYKQSGCGREGGHFGIEDFLEVKTVSGV
ncbi:MAG TPA: aldehyde dehydrogenase family protein [Acidiphilium sp.]